MKPLSRRALEIILITEILFFIITIFGTQLLKREYEIEMENSNKNRISYVVQSFNEQFEKYERNDATMLEVRSLIYHLIASNAAQKNNGTDRIVKYNGSLPKSIPYMSPKKTYTIKLEKDEETGYVNNCIVIPNE